MKQEFFLSDSDVFRIETETIQISTLGDSRPDPSWRFTDQQGHLHQWKDGSLPSLSEVTERYWCHDCRDEHEDLSYQCKICGEPVVPGWITGGPKVEIIPGPTSYFLNDTPISEEEAQAILRTRVANG